MKSKIKILLFITIWSIHINAQDVNNLAPNGYSIIPPAPEVASLMKYVDYPVSYFTGLPEINIPIYTIKTGSLELPISISYHGGGIKKNEVSGIVGLGWSLLAGASVSRTVHGIPDDIRTIDIAGLEHIDSYTKLLRDTIINRCRGEYNPNNIYSDYILPDLLCDKYNDGRADVANDIYRFYGNGLSGTFMYDYSTRKMILSTPNSITLRNLNMIPPFIINDDKMTTYIFSEEEKTKYEYHFVTPMGMKSDSLYYNSAWHLSKIINIHGDSILFSYNKPMRKHKYLGLSQYYSFSKDEELIRTSFNVNGNDVYYYPKTLKCISTKNTLVEFYYDDKCDTLKRILVRRNDLNKTIVKEYLLNHSNINNNNFLESIDEKADNQNDRLYTFSYNNFLENNGYPLGIDHW